MNFKATLSYPAEQDVLVLVSLFMAKVTLSYTKLALGLDSSSSLQS